LPPYGLSSGDFEPVFRQLLGETAAMSANTILRLKDEWEQEYQAWRRQPLTDEGYVYWWADASPRATRPGRSQRRPKTTQSEGGPTHQNSSGVRPDINSDWMD
jgi:hypothetical protein